MHSNKTFFFWSRWKQKYWLALRVFTLVLPLVMKCITVRPNKGGNGGKRTSGYCVCVEDIMVWSANRWPLCFRVQAHLLGAAPQPPPRQMKRSFHRGGGDWTIQTLKQARAALQEPSSNFSSKTSFTGLDLHICRMLKRKLTPLEFKTSTMRAWNQQPLLSTEANTVLGAGAEGQLEGCAGWS